MVCVQAFVAQFLGKSVTLILPRLVVILPLVVLVPIRFLNACLPSCRSSRRSAATAGRSFAL
jgi:hypothetical protein